MTDNPTTPTNDPTSPAPVPAPVPPQSVRIETTLWWEEGEDYSDLLLGPKRGLEGERRAIVRFVNATPGEPWIWSIGRMFEWHSAPTREAAKAAALQAVMDEIGAREVVAVGRHDVGLTIEEGISRRLRGKE